MATHNDITGDALVSRVSNSKYAEGYDRVFGKKKENTNVESGTNGVAVSVESVSSAGGTGSEGTVGSEHTEGSTGK